MSTKVEIKSRLTEEILFSAAVNQPIRLALTAALESAVTSGAYLSGARLSNADYYGRKIKREMDAHKRSEREAMKDWPTIGDFLWLGVCVMAGIGIGYLIAAYIVAMSPEAFEPSRPFSFDIERRVG